MSWSVGNFLECRDVFECQECLRVLGMSWSVGNVLECRDVFECQECLRV